MKKLERYKSLIEDAPIDLKGNIGATGGTAQGDLNFTVKIGNRPPVAFKLGKGKFEILDGTVKIKPEAKQEVLGEIKKAVEQTGLVKSGLKYNPEVLAKDLLIAANKIELSLKSNGEITGYKG